VSRRLFLFLNAAKRLVLGGHDGRGVLSFS